jgi:hypothetical protein
MLIERCGHQRIIGFLSKESSSAICFRYDCSSAFCAAVNQIRDVTMPHLPHQVRLEGVALTG